jgi:hypothetical protein
MERVGDLKKHDVWVVVFMAEHNALAKAAHSMLFVVILQSIQALFHRSILFRLLRLCANLIAAKRI